jgi:Fe-S cluster assembly scaffold protein SufB
MEGARIELPVQSCLVMKKDRVVQNVHNVIIGEANSEMHIITGCAAPSKVEKALHLGVSEFFLKKKAKLTFTMIHRWNENIFVRPRSGAILEENSVFISNYVILDPVKTIQSFPRVRLVGRNAKAELYSVIYGSKDSKYDIGGEISLEAPGTSGKIISRTISADSSQIVARGSLIGKAPGTRAHLECNGLMLSDTAKITAVPMLEAVVADTELSHEATVGKLGADQLNYLMSRGLTEDEATSLIVRGFISLKSPDLPPLLQRSIDEAITLTLARRF